MRIVQLVLTFFFIAATPRISFGADAGHTSIHAILIVASNEKGPSDPKLASYEPTLKRVLRFESFRYVGENSASVSPGTKATLTLPQGNKIELESEKSGGGVKVHHIQSGAVVPIAAGGRPVVLSGGPAGKKGEVFGIIVLAN